MTTPADILVVNFAPRIGGGGVITAKGDMEGQAVYWELVSYDPLTELEGAPYGSLRWQRTKTDASALTANVYLAPTDPIHEGKTDRVKVKYVPEFVSSRSPSLSPSASLSPSKSPSLSPSASPSVPGPSFSPSLSPSLSPSVPGSIFFDDFEAGNLHLWDEVSGVTISTGMSGSYCAEVPAVNNYIKVKMNSLIEVYACFKINIEETDGAVFNFYNDDTVLGLLQAEQVWGEPTKAAFTFYVGEWDDWFSDEVYTFDKGVSYEIKIYYLPHVSNGKVIVKVNEVTIISESGVQTAPSTLPVNKFGYGDVLSDYWLGAIFKIDDVLVETTSGPMSPSISPSLSPSLSPSVSPSS
jgi:hypothetical protein